MNISKQFVAAVFLIFFAATSPVKGYGANLPKSALYEVWIDNTEIRVGVFEQFDVPIHTVHYVSDVDKPAKIRIKSKEAVATYSISPFRKNIKGEVNGQELAFTIDQPEYLVIRINNKEDLFLMIDRPYMETEFLQANNSKNILDYGVDNTGKTLSTDRIQEAITDAAKRKRPLYFPPGIYATGQLNPVDNSTLYLAAGACIKASTDTADFKNRALICIEKASNVKIFGHGTIDGSGFTGLRKNGGQGYHLIYMEECKNVELDGLLLQDPCFWNVRVFRSANVHLKNIKVLNNRPEEDWNNTDGIDFDSSVNCSLTRAILHCGDDNLVVKGLDHERKFPAENIFFEKIITVSNSAATKIGTETCVEYFKNIVFREIDIVRCKRAIAINAYDSALVENVRFENINIEQFDPKGVAPPRLIDFEITDNSWRPCTGNANIKNISIRNVNLYTNMQGISSQIVGKTTDYAVKNVLIENLRIQGKPINHPRDINMTTNEYVFNLKIINPQ